MRSTHHALCILLALAATTTVVAQTGSRGHPVTAASFTTTSTTTEAFPAPRVSSLSEGFENITLLTGAGWFFQNNSQPHGMTSWTQGPNMANQGPFDAHAGGTNSFISANFNNTTGGTGTISNWLVTPELDFGAGATFTFHTRKASPDTYADRLEVRISTHGASTNVGTGGTGTGDFSTTLLSINPNLTLGVYPTAWTSFTLSHAQGLPHSGTGRIAFRYHVTGAGPTGNNSDFIGIDTVSYEAGPPEYTIGGTVSGLAGSGLALTLNGGTPFAIAQDGSFTFPGYHATGTAYVVQVQAQPGTPSQTCSITNGSGTATATVTAISVTCTTESFSVGGSISGLEGEGLVLRNGADTDLTITAGTTSFTFPPQLDLSTYSITVPTQPGTPSQTCTVTDGNGALAGDDVDDVVVTCVTRTFPVGGTISGLTGSGLSLTLGGQTLTVPAYATGFTFPNSVASGSNYAVAIQSPPRFPHQICTLSNGSGTIGDEEVDDVGIACILDADVLFANDFEIPPTPTHVATAKSVTDTSIASRSSADSQASTGTSSTASTSTSTSGSDAQGVSSAGASTVSRGTPDAVPLPTLDRVALAVLAGLLVLATAWTRRRRVI